MNPLRLSAVNYGPFADVEWEIPGGLTSIVGHNLLTDGANSNGSGKTTLLEMIPVALFGPALPWGEYLTTGSDETQCRVELEFEHAGETYRIRRTYDAKGRGKTTLDFERFIDCDPEDTWDSLTRDAQTETQKLIEQTIGLSEATFAHSVFAAQGARHFADPTLAPRERKAILTEALGLGVWDDLLALVRTDIGIVSGELSGIAMKLGAFEDDLAQKPEIEQERAELTLHVGICERDLSEQVERETAARTAREEAANAEQTRRALRAEHDRAKAALDALDNEFAAGERAVAETDGIKERIAVLKPLVDAVAEVEARAAAQMENDLVVSRATANRDAIVALIAPLERRATAIVPERGALGLRVTEFTSQIAKIQAGTEATCAHCGQALTGPEAVEAAVAGVRRDIDTLMQRDTDLATEQAETAAQIIRLRGEADAVVIPTAATTEERAALAASLQDARTAALELAKLTERLTAAQAAAAVVTDPAFQERRVAAQVALDDAAAALRPTDGIDYTEALAHATRDLERANLDVTVARTTLSQVQARHAAAGERLRNLAALTERAQESIAARDTLTDRLASLRVLEKAYGRDGIPALILEATAIPHLETEARRVLEALGMPFRIELVTQRENKGGGLKDTLDVVVHEPNGSRQYQRYSGGEKTRLEFALRIAFARLIAQTSGSQNGVLILDELAYLDATGIAQVADVLRSLTEHRAIVLVSHDERLADVFDQQITVVRDESGSRLEEAA